VRQPDLTMSPYTLAAIMADIWLDAWLACWGLKQR